MKLVLRTIKQGCSPFLAFKGEYRWGIEKLKMGIGRMGVRFADEEEERKKTT